MPKRVKTKKQKILADLRRKNSPSVIEKTDFTTYTLPTTMHVDSPKSDMPGKKIASAKAVSTSGYAYLYKDLRKTLLLTSSIIIAEILIRSYLKI